jgi:phosphate transport system substrate-binding protein
MSGRLTSAVYIWVVAIGLTTACSVSAGTGPASTGPASAGQAASVAPGPIKEDGSGLLLPLMQQWAIAYQVHLQGVTVQVTGGGSTKGINDASSGAVDIGASDAYLSSGDVLKNPALLNIPLVVSAQSVIYNLPGLKTRQPGVSAADIHVQLSGSLLAAMYSGAITMWNDSRIQALNGNLVLPAIKIAPLHRKSGSGDTFLFTSYLSTQDYNWNRQVGYGTQVVWPDLPTAQAPDGSAPMITQCAQTPGCVGYNGVSYLSRELSKGLGEAALQNGGGHFTAPTPKTIQAEVNKFVAITPPNETIAMIAGPGGDTYPLVNYEYAIVSTRQPSEAKAKQLRDFLTWVITAGNAGSFVNPVNFQPLPPDLRKLSATQIGLIR